MIKTAEELRVKLEGKTERTEIETILNGATIGAMKGYIEAERYDICTGRNLVKADYVKALTSVVCSLLPEEKPDSVADEKVIRFLKKLTISNIDVETCVRVMASMSLYEKITSTREPHKFSNLPEPEIRVMLGFDACYNHLGSECGMYGLFTNDLNTVNVEDTAKAAKYFEELVRRVFQADYDKATGHNTEITPECDNDNALASQPTNAATVQSEDTAQPEITVSAEITQPEIISPYDYDINAMSPNTAPITPSAVKNSALLEVSQPENLYMDDSFSDAPGDNSCPNQDIPESHMPEEVPATVKANQSEEKFLQCRSISAKTKEITAMLNRYVEINGTVRVIHDGIKIFRKGIKIREKQGLPTDAFEKAIKEVREKYREWRIEGFKLRQKLLRVISTEEIRRACEMYIARCERIRRRHMRK